MLAMILKMTAVTSLYVLLTVIIWNNYRGKPLTLKAQVLVGVIYGLCSVLSTHYGVDYGDMLLNVRDIGPLAAGLLFHPLSGVISGLIGGIERYIAGTYLGVGSYTRVACSVSTCLAGFLSLLLNRYIFRGKKPSPIYAFFIGAVMEVFHMYVVFITHRDDMKMAFHVVKYCSIPMIIFTGLGLAASSLVLQVMAGEWKRPSGRLKGEDVPVSRRFQFWLFVVTLLVFIINFGLSFAMQTQTAFQNARITLAEQANDTKRVTERIRTIRTDLDLFAREQALVYARGIAKMIEEADDKKKTDNSILEEFRKIYGLDAVYVLNAEGRILGQAAIPWKERDAAAAPDAPGTGEGTSEEKVSEGKTSGEAGDNNPDERTEILTDTKVAAYVKCGDLTVQTVLDKNTLSTERDLQSFRDLFGLFYVNTVDIFDIFTDSRRIVVGSHSGEILNRQEFDLIKENLGKKSFFATLFGVEYLCRSDKLDDEMYLLTMLESNEVYAARDAQAYENTFANILLFTVIYILITYLVQKIVVNNLTLINQSLSRITDGDLDEIVSVRDSSEFASLSDDINQTVDTLKGYIEAAEKRIEQELIFAHAIQDAALPKNYIFPRKEFDLYATMDPAKEVGGDFYDFFFVDMDKLVLVIADVSGKGIPAALFMMRAKTTIRSLAESGSSAGEIFYKANNTLCEGNDAEMFVTAWIGILDLKTGRMECANAGHEYPAIRRAGQDYKLYYDKHTMPLATIENIRAREYEIKLESGDKLFVYTDGIPEAINENLEEYGTDRLIRMLNTLKEATEVETLFCVRQDISIFAGDAEQFDDVTMLGLEYHGSEDQEE